jgi:valyl-tRNA synthetase
VTGVFSIPMIPPNLTGDLHLGHALMASVQDSLARFRRQEGREVHYLPGVDHAGVGMYTLVLSNPDYRPDLPIERRLRDWAVEHRAAIRDQFRALDLICDWDRETYTLEPRYQRLVRATFERLAAAGLVYRARKVVHWCPRCGTTISDIECERSTAPRPVALLPARLGSRRWVIEHPEPELLPGAVACRVPVDPGEDAEVTISGLPHPLPAVGGGTPRLLVPAHDAGDHALALRMGLPVSEVLDGAGRSLLAESAGLDREQLRARVLERWDLKSTVKQVETWRCGRCDTELMGRLTWQWFLRMRPLLDPLMAAVRAGEVRFLPERITREAMDWLARADDWCLSRQVPWGHRVPARVCRRCAGWTTARLRRCPDCNQPLDVERDVLDTWFSVSLWPIATAGWPDEDAMGRLYPMSAMTTGRDILFFMFVRMLALCRFMTGAYPTPTCYYHGLVVAADGTKMSKSRGNAVSVPQALASHDADVLRTALLSGCAGARDVRLRDQLFDRAGALRDRLLEVERLAAAAPSGADGLTEWCRWLVRGARELVAAALDRFAYAEAVEALTALSDRAVLRWLRVRALGGPAGEGDEGPLLRELGRLFEPFMPAAGTRLQRLGRQGAGDPDPVLAGAVERFVAAVEELEQLRGAVGINTVDAVTLVLPEADRRALAGERWLTAATRLRLAADGEPGAGAVCWRSTRAPGAVLWLPAGRDGRLRAEAVRQLRVESNQLRRLRRRAAALADPSADLVARREELAVRVEALRANAGTWRASR